ncbi:MAG: hypothetical protein ACI4E1_04830 [Lachnospira sp.]
MKLDLRKKEKGDFGYLNYRKSLSLLIVIAAYLVVAAVFVTGFLIFKSKNNIVTVMAILLVLPAAKFTVSFLVLAPHKSCDDAFKTRMDKIVERNNNKNVILYDCVVSNSKKPYGVQLVLVSDSSIIAFSEEKGIDKKFFETSVKEFLKNDKLNVNVTLYSDSDSFISRANSICVNSGEDGYEYKALANAKTFKLMCI